MKRAIRNPCGLARFESAQTVPHTFQDFLADGGFVPYGLCHLFRLCCLLGGHQKPPFRVVVQVTLPSQFFTHRVVVCAWASVAARAIAMMMMIDFMVLSCWLQYNKFV
jgi:hypothetical protein